MKKDMQRIIDEQASIILKSKLPSAHWQVYDINPDISKDHQVELVEKGLYLGITFIVQQKGQKKVRQTPDGKYVKYRIETEYLKYYEKLRAPVFLILIDLGKGTGYWLFIQKYLREVLSDKQWLSQKTQTLYIPTTNTLDEPHNLRKAVYNADNYMAAIHPGAMHGSIKTEQDRLEAMDPRFNVKIIADENGENCVLHAKEQVNATILFKGHKDTIKQKVDDLIKKGNPTSWKSDEIEVIGSPLVAETMKSFKTITMKWGISQKGMMVIREAKGNNTTSAICTLPLILEGGLEEVRLEIGYKSEPLKLSIVVPSSGFESIFHISVNWDIWKGQSLTKLAMFQEVHALTTAIMTGSDLICEGLIPGIPPILGRIQNNQLSQPNIINIVENINLIHKMRQIAEYFNVERKCPQNMDEMDSENIEMVFSLISTGEYSRAAPYARVTLKINMEKDKDSLPFINATTRETLTINGTSSPIDFLGSSVDIGPYTIAFSRMILENYETIKSGLGKECAETDVVLIGDAESRVEYRLSQQLS